MHLKKTLLMAANKIIMNYRKLHLALYAIKDSRRYKKFNDPIKVQTSKERKSVLPNYCLNFKQYLFKEVWLSFSHIKDNIMREDRFKSIKFTKMHSIS